MGICTRCGGALSGKQTKYCSEYCSKLHLKALYRERNREKLREYAKGYKKRLYGAGGFEKARKSHLRYNPVCEKCGTNERLEVHHIKPVMLGGTNKDGNLMTLCARHHTEFEKLTKNFFKP